VENTVCFFEIPAFFSAGSVWHVFLEQFGMDFDQPLSNEPKTALLHIQQQCRQEFLDDFITWVNNRLQPMQLRTIRGSTDGVVDKADLHNHGVSHAYSKSYMMSCYILYMLSYMIA
jgi:hypothetical protein